MDWAEERYDVSFTLFKSLKFQKAVAVSGLTAVHIMSVCAAETPHCSNQNGAEGPLFIHPTSDVLDPI